MLVSAMGKSLVWGITQCKAPMQVVFALQWNIDCGDIITYFRDIITHLYLWCFLIISDD